MWTDFTQSFFFGLFIARFSTQPRNRNNHRLYRNKYIAKEMKLADTKLKTREELITAAEKLSGNQVIHGSEKLEEQTAGSGNGLDFEMCDFKVGCVLLVS